MTHEETKEILRRQMECFIRRTEGCDGKCLACDLLATKEDVLEAYDKAISAVDYKGYWVAGIYCSKCGTKGDKNWKYCPDCGVYMQGG